MEIKIFTIRMASNLETIRSLVFDVPSEQARWRPAPDKWSILEVVNHLWDEEREDFRTRLQMTLTNPKEAWPGIDPPGWVNEREYNQRDLAESLEGFLAERRQSISWLGALESPHWENAYQHPLLGEIKAGTLLTSWVAHDYLHLRQLTKLHLDYVLAKATPYGMDYAGNW